MPTAVAAQRCAATAAAAYVAFRNMLTDSPRERAADPLHATLVTTASRPLEPSRIKKRILLPIGAILGLLLGLGAVVLRDAFDGRVRDQADLEKCLDAPVLTAVPQIKGRSADPEFVFSQAPLSRAAEAYRYLRARLDPLLTATPDRGTVLLVASAQPREGRTCVATNLATALAQSGATVLLVDADLRRPAIGELFGTGEGPGLTDMLGRTASLDDVAVYTNVPSLRIVTIGRPVGQPADIFETTRLARVFTAMRAAADVIVVDSGPILSVSDAIAVTRVSDVVAIVGDIRRTKRSAVSTAVAEIRAMEPETIVGVLNRAPGPLLASAARPSVTHKPPLSPSATVTGKLAHMAPQSGNGLKRSSLSLAWLSRHGRSDEDDPHDAAP
jgi:capsular exopolysaccharide synthesis family protein